MDDVKKICRKPLAQNYNTKGTKAVKLWILWLNIVDMDKFTVG